MSSNNHRIYVILMLCFVIMTAQAQFQMQAARTLIMSDPIRPIEVLYNGRKVRFVLPDQTEIINKI
jgi:hypothetical protein